MASNNSSQRDLLKELGFGDDVCLDEDSSQDEDSEKEISLDNANYENIMELKKLLKQTQLELRTAQNSLIQTECGKEKKFKILRKAHQSALSLKNSLIQELQDIISGKDEYISQLEDRLNGKKTIEVPKDAALTKLVSKFTELSRDYVELQSHYERTQEELTQERINSTCTCQMTKISETSLMLDEIKKLKLNLKLLESERQKYLHFKEENMALLYEIEELKKNSFKDSPQPADTNDTVFKVQISSLEEQLQLTRLRNINLEKENSDLHDKCKELKELLDEKDSHMKANSCVQKCSSVNNFEDINQTQPKPSIVQSVFEIFRLVQDIVSQSCSVLNEMKHFSKMYTEELLSVSDAICATLLTLCKRTVVIRRRYLSEMKQRKYLHNQLVELKGNIRVFCRIRPTIDQDGTGNDASIVVKADSEDDCLLQVENRGTVKIFEVDKVFGPNSSQQHMFKEVQPLITSCIDGYNVCIIAYGQTGSGKTYTMEGTADDPGINQRALYELFSRIKSSQSEWKYSILVSMLEIYNECAYDLLSGNNKLDIKLNSEGLYLPGLTQVSVTNLDEVNTVLSLGHKNRSTASTKMNICSSRSHAVLSISVMGSNDINGIKTFGKLNLVDLAGSERVHKSGSDGIRLQEAKNINKSLSSLADVIYNLRIKSSHIPYRNSKLTYLLQDSLGGNAKTTMIVQLSPVQKNSSETVCSLNFAQRARAVELKHATK